MQVEVGVNVRVLVVVRRHIEHLQPGGGVGPYRRHPLCVEPLCSESLCVAQVGAQLRRSQHHPSLHVVQPGMELGEVVGGPGDVGETDGPVSGKVLHGVGRLV